MAKKPKASGSKKEAREKAISQKEQSARFIEAARMLGVDETGKEFEGVTKKLLVPKKATQSR